MSLLQLPTKSWWETDDYQVEAILPPQMEDPTLWGEKGPALVKVFGDGSTQAGWGLQGRDGGKGFIERYAHGEFLQRRVEPGYAAGKHATALVTRSGRVACVDIDGKNGGLAHIGQLGALPYTAAETSKSGNGFHIYYRTRESWSPTEGFALIPDQIGIVQGVDIRGTGCVYHYPSQRWNTAELALMPEWLERKLTARKQRQMATASIIQKTLQGQDETEILLMHAELLDELAKPIPAGRRNNTLFAIGTKLKLAEMPDWETKVETRAGELGLSSTEAEKLVTNINNYGV